MKTDWKDAIFTQKKIRLTENDDGTVTPTDETEYTQEGDAFGANELNAIGKEFNQSIHVTQVTLTASGWSGSSAPYTQTVNVSNAKSSLEPILVSALADGANANTQKAYAKAFGIISSGTATVGDGNATFKVYKKPATDCTVGLMGV